MHLYIEQNTGLTETVSSSVIKKLYELAVGGLDNTSNLIGSVSTTVTSAKYKTYLEGLFPNFHVTANEYTLTFEDAEVERVCIANWGSNGSVTGAQLAAVVNMSNTFKNNTTITNGDDFVYFTGLTGNGGNMDVSGCTNMTQITLPPNITQMPNVSWCTSLTSITGLDHINSVSNGRFNRCTALQSLTFTNLTGVCEIGEHLTSLTSISLNEGCTKFSINGNNSVMTSISIPSSVTQCDITSYTGLTTITFGQNSNMKTTGNYGGFSGCSSLTTINNFPWDSWTTMGSYSFYGCTSLTGIVKSPIGQTTIPNYCFMNMGAIDTIIIDSAVTSIGGYNFNGIKTGAKVIMNPTTPPTLSHTVTGAGYGYANTTGCVFYVPDASYNDYISNGGQYWTELYDNGRLKKMSELPS